MKQTINKVRLIICSLFLIYGSLAAQTTDYQTRIRLLQAGITYKLSDTKTGLYLETTDSIQKDNPHAWLWPMCAYIQAANELDRIEPGKRYMLPVERAVEQYYSNKPPFPAYQDYVTKERESGRFYDDNQWIAIAYLDAYDRTRQKHYLEKSEMICRFMLNGLDTVTGGGIYWKEGEFKSKNTCSNGPGILVLLQLYKITRKSEYLSNALAIYQWANKYLQAPEGIYYDNISTKSLKIDKATYTYNTGTMLQSNVLLYQLTKDKKYLLEAQRIALAGRNRFFKSGRLPNGNYWFNAVMLRGYEALYLEDKNKAWLDFYFTDADAIWNTERDSNDMVGNKPIKSLIDQAAMIEIYARLSKFKAIK